MCIRDRVIRGDEQLCINDCIPNQFKSALTDWVLFRMYSFDTDVPDLRNRANMHREYFELAVDKQYRYRQAQGSGFWNGAIGSGDGAFRSRSP